MYYAIYNYLLERNIGKKRYPVRRRLLKELGEINALLEEHTQGNKAVLFVYGRDGDRIKDQITELTDRIQVDDRYTILRDYFQLDNKRLLMINRAFSNYLKAVSFLYGNSGTFKCTGILAPKSTYEAIANAKKLFSEILNSISDHNLDVVPTAHKNLGSE